MENRIDWVGICSLGPTLGHLYLDIPAHLRFHIDSKLEITVENILMYGICNVFHAYIFEILSLQFKLQVSLQ
jgi:hypothetical protein